MFPKSPLPLLLVLALTGCGTKPVEAKPARPDNRFAVVIAPAATRELVPETTVLGRFEAAETARCVARVAGPVARVLVGEGRAVKAGDPLVELDATRLRLALASADADLVKAQAAVEEATRLLRRREELAKAGLATDEDRDAAATRASQAAAAVLAARAARDRAQADVADAVITAPVTGVIERKSVDTGQWLPVGAEVFTIVRRDPLQIRAQVPPEVAANLAPNLPVTVRAEGQEAAGALVLIAQAADPATGRVPVLARLSQPPATHRPGGFGDLVVRGAPRSAITVPAEAIRPTERGLVVFLARDDKAQERTVTTGTRTADGQVEITQGLTAGDPVIVRGADALRDGSLLRLPDDTERPAKTGKPTAPAPAAP